MASVSSKDQNCRLRLLLCGNRPWILRFQDCCFPLQSRCCLAEVFQELTKSKIETSRASSLSKLSNVHFSSLFSH